MIHIIAEIGSNWCHVGQTQDSKAEILRSISAAANAGADIVKFQLFTAAGLYSKERAPQLWERVRPYEFPISFLDRARSHANQCGVQLWASVFVPQLCQAAATYLDGLKVASGDLTNLALIEAVAEASRQGRLPLAISTGAGSYEEIATAIQTARAKQPHQLILFYCVSSYPADEADLNLLGGTLFQREVDAIGFSDHTMHAEAAQLALALGYSYFEKHFHSFSAPKDSPDRVVSLDPNAFAEYVQALQRAQQIVGRYQKTVAPSEVAERLYARRGADGLRPNVSKTK